MLRISDIDSLAKKILLNVKFLDKYLNSCIFCALDLSSARYPFNLRIYLKRERERAAAAAFSLIDLSTINFFKRNKKITSDFLKYLANRPPFIRFDSIHLLSLAYTPHRSPRLISIFRFSIKAVGKQLVQMGVKKVE
jgi:hypothetical protein